MSDVHDHDIWHLLYVQTPPVLRWTMIVLSLGFMSLLAWVLKDHKRDYLMHKQEFQDAVNEHDAFRDDITSLQEHHNYMNQKVDMIHEDFRSRFDKLDESVETLTSHLIKHIDKK